MFYLRDLAYIIIEYFKNMFNNCRITSNADNIQTFEKGRWKEQYITRYFIS